MADINSLSFQGNRPLLKEVTADRLNSILTEIRRNKPKGERGITVRHSGDGTYIGLASSGGKGGGSASLEYPFKLVSTGETSFSVTPGTINGIIAGNWSAEFNATTTLNYIIVRASCASNKIVSTELQVTTTVPGEPTPLAWSVPTQFDALIGMVEVNTETNQMQLFQIAYTNLTYSVVKRVTVSSGTPSLPYTNYYTWQPV